MIAILTSVRWYRGFSLHFLILVMLSIFLCASWLCLSLEKCLFMSTTHFLVGLFNFWNWATELFIYFRCLCVCASLLNHVWLFVTLWTAAHQAPLSMGLSEKNTGVSCSFPPPGDLRWPKDQTHISCVLLYCRQILYPLNHPRSRNPWSICHL